MGRLSIVGNVVLCSAALSAVSLSLFGQTEDEKYFNARAAYEARDYETALALLLPLADRGHAPSQTLLAEYYAYGNVFSTDEGKAMMWLERAADQGYATAQRKIGLNYAYASWGVDKDIDEAMRWFALAAAQGDEVAKKKVDEYKSYDAITDKYNIVRSGAADLGLSVKWAACNLGAGSPEEYGDWYAWGETRVKDEYTWKSYDHCEIWMWNNIYLTKYNTVESYGNVDGKLSLEAIDDAASVKLGGSWRIPTEDECRELIGCRWERIDYYWTTGFVVTGPSGVSIFIEAEDTYLSPDIEANYMTSSYDTSEPCCTSCLNVSGSGANGDTPAIILQGKYKSNAMCIRPVCSK